MSDDRQWDDVDVDTKRVMQPSWGIDRLIRLATR